MVPHPAPKTSTTLRLSFLRPSAGSLPTGLSTGAPCPLPWPAGRRPSAQPAFIITYCKTSRSLRRHVHVNIGCPSVGTGLVVGDVTLRNSRCSSVSETRVFSAHKQV